MHCSSTWESQDGWGDDNSESLQEEAVKDGPQALAVSCSLPAVCLWAELRAALPSPQCGAGGVGRGVQGGFRNPAWVGEGQREAACSWSWAGSSRSRDGGLVPAGRRTAASFAAQGLTP